MNRIVWAAVAAGLVATAADTRADFGGPYPPQPVPEGHGHRPPPGMYGYNPVINALCWWKRKEAIGTATGQVGSNYDIPRGAVGPGAYGPPGAALPGTPANQMPGTLVFPYHPYVRSPRDFFMYEPGGR